MRELKEERKKTKGKYKKYPASLHTMFCTARTDTGTEETCLKTVFVSAQPLEKERRGTCRAAGTPGALSHYGMA